MNNANVHGRGIDLLLDPEHRAEVTPPQRDQVTTMGPNSPGGPGPPRSGSPIERHRAASQPILTSAPRRYIGTTALGWARPGPAAEGCQDLAPRGGRTRPAGQLDALRPRAQTGVAAGAFADGSTCPRSTASPGISPARSSGDATDGRVTWASPPRTARYSAQNTSPRLASTTDATSRPSRRWGWASRSSDVAPDEREIERRCQGLGGGDPDPQTGEQPGSDVDRDQGPGPRARPRRGG